MRFEKGDEMTRRVALLSTEYPPYPGGIATYVGGIAKALAALGHRPTIIGVGPEAPEASEGVETRHIALPAYSHKQLPLIARKTRALLAAEDYDVIFACDYRMIMAIGWLNRRARMVAGVHGTDIKSKILTSLGAAGVYRPLRNFRKVVANSEFTKSELLSNHPYVDPGKVDPVPLGVDAFWREPDVGSDVLERLAIGEDRIVLVSAGRLERRKGQNITIAALERLPPHLRERVTYLIVGKPVEADYTAELEAAIAAGAADVRLLGVVTREDIRALYHRAHALMHTATYIPRKAEGFGLVIAEAAAAGAPAIASRVDAIPEVAIDQVTGLLTNDGDLDDVARAITALIEEPGLRERLAAGAKARSDMYVWEVAAKAVLNEAA